MSGTKWWWPWWREPYWEPLRPEGAAGRVPDGDTVPLPGHARWTDLLKADQAAARDAALHGPTAHFPLPEFRLTRGQAWRADHGRRAAG